MDREDDMHDVSESPRLYHVIHTKIYNFWPVKYFWLQFLDEIFESQ